MNNNITKCLKLLDNSYRRDFNSVRINTHNTLEHEIGKCKIAYNLIKNGYTILTEAIFKNKSRADILVLDTMTVYEILHSETEKEALHKTSKYPKDLTINFIKSSEIDSIKFW